MTDYQQRGETFSVLGSKYDLFEGIYGPADWKRLCQFLELDSMILIINILLRFLWIQI